MNLVRPIWVLACVAALHILVAGPAFAQTPADEFAREQAQQEQAKRLDALKRMTPDNAAAARPVPEPKVTAGGRCFAISKVVIEGVRQFPAVIMAPVVKPYEHKCIGMGEINTLLRDLTVLYLDKGFITTRVYVPQQDMAKTKRLRLVVVEGKLADIYLNGKPAPESGALRTAFPALRGTITNMRDIEQGLDQINRLGSNSAKTAILPGPDADSSILNVENKPGNPFHFSLANSNLGQKSTGFSKSSVSLTADGLIGINDMLSFTYEHSGPDYPWNDDGVGKSNSYSGNFSVPYGYWTLSANGSWYEYKSSVPGNFSTMETTGDSKQAGFGLDRVILRDRDSITTAKSGLTYKQTNNFLLGSKIENGSRQYTVGSLGISHSRSMFNGLWVFDATYDQGLDLLGAVEKGTPGAGGANPKFSKLNAAINISRPFELAGQRFELPAPPPQTSPTR
jgi:hemolysin activation/secretion protein